MVRPYSSARRPTNLFQMVAVGPSAAVSSSGVGFAAWSMKAFATSILFLSLNSRLRGIVRLCRTVQAFSLVGAFLRHCDEMGLWRGAVAAGGGLGVGGVAAGRVEAQRLPGGVRPVHYSLTITPDFGKATFAGTETIDVVLDKPATSITLNAAEIEFGAVTAESREQRSEERR